MSKKIKIGIIGAGRMAGWFSEGLTVVEDAVRYAVGSRTLEKAQAFVDKYGYEKAYGSYEEILNDPEVDLVYIATPIREHYANITAALEAGKTPEELERSISKEFGEEDFYLDTDRVYRTEKDVFDEYTEEERDRFFGKAPQTVWENLRAFEEYPQKLEIFKRDDVMTDTTLESYREAVLSQWKMELRSRIIPDMMNTLRRCRNWERISKLRDRIGRNTVAETCLLTQIIEALEAGDYQAASDLQVEMQTEVEKLIKMYLSYKKNLF